MAAPASDQGINPNEGFKTPPLGISSECKKPSEAVDYWAAKAKNIETVYIGHGLHYVQEDNPFAIGRAISDWYRRINN